MIIFKHVLACCGKIGGCWVETEDEDELTVESFFLFCLSRSPFGRATFLEDLRLPQKMS